MYVAVVMYVLEESLHWCKMHLKTIRQTGQLYVYSDIHDCDNTMVSSCTYMYVRTYIP